MIPTKKPDFSKRAARPHSIGGAFGGLMRILGARASDADLAKRWGEIMGPELSGAAALVGVSKTGKATQNGRTTGRTMTVRAVVPAMAMPLSYRMNDFMERANLYFGYAAIGKVVVRK
jgi:hypothetical protein